MIVGIDDPSITEGDSTKPNIDPPPPPPPDDPGAGGVYVVSV